MPLALFIVVGMAALAVAISRMSGNTQSSAIYESLSVQALYAAESGMQYQMNQLLFNAVSEAEVDTRCASVNGTSISFTVSGLNNCTAQSSCSKKSNQPGRQVYELFSSSSCGAGQFIAQRSIRAAALYHE